LALALGASAPSGEMAATLGVRPEDIHIGPAGALSGQVTLVEPMGNHQVVWLDCGGHSLSAIAPGGMRLDSGASVRFAVDAARVSLFDPLGGQRLGAAEPLRTAAATMTPERIQGLGR
jgi:multiple sugar transport system ATP-binding protein